MYNLIFKNKNSLKICKSLLLNRINTFYKVFPRNKASNLRQFTAELRETKIKDLSHYDSVKLQNIATSTDRTRKYVGSWLLTCSGMVYIAVTLGGVTRLTESGLSMVTWKLLGEKIPSSHESWLDEFEKYKKFPEYIIMNKDLTMEEFKKIWWMEYTHRMWGRLTGAVFIIPASFFWMRNMFSTSLKKNVMILGTLLFCQGLMGWYMVKSGLTNTFDEPSDVPRVSQYRLAAHLSLAVIMYAGFLYNALNCLVSVKHFTTSYENVVNKTQIDQLKKLRFLTHSIAGLTFLTIISGAFVAGLDAGLIYNTFPKMSNKWIPDDIFFMTPALKNVTENPATVQFNHRLLGMLTLTAATCVGYMGKKYKLLARASAACTTLCFAAYLQATLGILTLLNHVPTYLAALHQSGSLFLLTSTVWLLHEMKYVKHLSKLIK